MGVIGGPRLLRRWWRWRVGSGEARRRHRLGEADGGLGVVVCAREGAVLPLALALLFAHLFALFFLVPPFRLLRSLFLGCFVSLFFPPMSLRLYPPPRFMTSRSTYYAFDTLSLVTHQATCSFMRARLEEVVGPDGSDHDKPDG